MTTQENINMYEAIKKMTNLEDEIYELINHQHSATIAEKLGMKYQNYLYKKNRRTFTKLELFRINTITHNLKT